MVPGPLNGTPHHYPASRRSRVSIWPSSTLTPLVLGRPPAHADLLRHLRVAPPSVNQMLITLERQGLIRRQPGVARSVELLIDPSTLPQLLPSPGQPVKTKSY
jgi:hypothetical protein